MKFVITFLALFLFSGVSLASYQIIDTIDAPDANISGLGYGNGSLWAVDCVTENAYQVNPATGAVQNSWFCADPYPTMPWIPSGLTFANNTVYIIVNRYTFLANAYMYNTSGIKFSEFSLTC